MPRTDLDSQIESMIIPKKKPKTMAKRKKKLPKQKSVKSVKKNIERIKKNNEILKKYMSQHSNV